jgi:hypothetical protein
VQQAHPEGLGEGTEVGEELGFHRRARKSLRFIR